MKVKKATRLTRQTPGQQDNTLDPVYPNAGVRVWYQKQLDSLIDEMNHSYTYWLEANYRKGLAMDASPIALLKKMMGKLSRQWESRFADMASELAGNFTKRVKQHGDASLSNAFDKHGFTVKFTMTKGMKNAIDGTIAENVGLIKNIPSHYHAQLETIVMQSIMRGRDLGTLSNELRDRLGITKRRAALIARDQNNKATAIMQSQRQIDLGITLAIWVHSGGGKVPRANHLKAGREKLVFELAKGAFIDGQWILPGEMINCRCTWRAVIPGFQ